MHRLLLPALALAPVLSGCGDGGASDADPRTAFKALGQGDYSAAMKTFDAAMAGMEADDPEYLELAVGRCEALAHVDGAKVEAAMLKLKGLKAKDYASVASALLEAGEYETAVRVMDQGVKALPDDPAIQELEQRVVKEVESSGDAAANSALSGLGYGGGD